MANTYQLRRTFVLAVVLAGLFGFVIFGMPTNIENATITTDNEVLGSKNGTIALDSLKTITIKGRAAKTGYTREQFGAGWSTRSGCDIRNIILNRDLQKPVVDEECNVTSGTLIDPYTGKVIVFKRGSDTSSKVQIDHVVALSDAWQKGAQALSAEIREALANDPLELLAVDGGANLEKSDGDAASWLPPNKSFRCQYVARQIAVKSKYALWMTQTEYDVVKGILLKCPNQLLPSA